MRRKALLVLVGSVVVAGALLAAWWLAGLREAGRVGSSAAPLPTQKPVPTVPVTLYFPGPSGRLYAEERRVAPQPTPEKRIRTLIAALLEGPETSGLAPLLGQPAEVGWVDVAPDGVAYLDLRSPDHAPPPPSGSDRELLTVYSFVDSILANVPEAHSVVLLWNDRQPETFAGHVDLTRPLGADRSLVAD